VALNRDEYERQIERQERAVVDLRAGGSLLHAVARAYYLVYVTASYVATVHGVTATHVRQGKVVTEADDFSHNTIPDVVEALYSGNKRGRVSPGSTPGIGAGNFTDREAAKKADLLQRDRKDADYGPTLVPEPYSPNQADERIRWAHMLVGDLRKLL
jgi:hypothetical protein